MSTQKPNVEQRDLSDAENDRHFEREWRDEKWQNRQLSQAAADRAHVEHALTPGQAIRAYPMAIFWCLAVSMCVVMEGYDTILIGNFFAFPSFQRQCTYSKCSLSESQNADRCLDGEFVGVTDQTRSGYQLTPAWMAGLGNASGIGAFFGTLLCGYLVALFGQKRVILGSLIVLSCTIFLTFFAPNIKVLIVGQILCGLPWGALATIAPSYASECLPMALRVYFTSWTNMCFIIGMCRRRPMLRLGNLLTHDQDNSSPPAFLELA